MKIVRFEWLISEYQVGAGAVVAHAFRDVGPTIGSRSSACRHVRAPARDLVDVSHKVGDGDGAKLRRCSRCLDFVNGAATLAKISAAYRDDDEEKWL